MPWAEISALTVKEILGIIRKYQFSIPHYQTSSKETLLAYIAQNASVEVLNALENCSREKEDARTYQISMETGEQGDSTRRQRRRIEEYRPTKARINYNSAEYLENATHDEIKACYTAFYKATSNNAVKQVVCAICGREVGVIVDDVRIISLDDLANKHRLVPYKSHPSHTLFDGKLLEPAGVKVINGNHYQVNVCQQCRTSLESSKNDLPPVLSLANNMWIGIVPKELSSLTLSEQLLISHLYPRVYVFKLYTKKPGSEKHPESLQRAMRGTVSTFELNMDSITSMLEGNLMPRRPSILASLVSVTYIGLGRLPKKWLRYIFRVRRQKVLSALLWLKANNTKYYGDITISKVNIETLPDDDVPVELLSIVRQSTDVGVVDQESSGYVPAHENENNDEEEDEIMC